jgi:hypothetical protein
MSKRLLIIKAAKDICASEIDHIKIVAEMFGIVHCTTVLTDVASFKSDLCAGGKYDYIYLAAHADIMGFGESDGSISTDWSKFAEILCEAECLNPECILLLGCCRGGLKKVAAQLFYYCSQIDYVCGPRWTVTGQDISLGFHIFVYNIEIRREQPSTAVERASKGTGYDFFCHDRVEFEDTYRPNTLK